MKIDEMQPDVVTTLNFNMMCMLTFQMRECSLHAFIPTPNENWSLKKFKGGVNTPLTMSAKTSDYKEKPLFVDLIVNYLLVGLPNSSVYLLYI